jgi:hypothetical protein
MKNTKIAAVAAIALLGGLSQFAQGQTYLGTFQGAGDPLNTGWYDWQSSIAITATSPPADNQYAFVSGVVPGFSQSLQVTPSTGGYDQNLTLNMSGAQMTAWQNNSYLTFTWSEPGSSTESGGYSQIPQLIFNTAGSATGVGFGSPVPFSLFSESGYTYNNNAGMPVYDYWGAGGTTERSMEVTVDYASIMAADPSFATGYFQMILVSEYGGGAPSYSEFNAFELSTGPFGTEVPEPSTIALGVIGASSFLLRRRIK